MIFFQNFFLFGIRKKYCSECLYGFSFLTIVGIAQPRVTSAGLGINRCAISLNYNSEL